MQAHRSGGQAAHAHAMRRDHPLGITASELPWWHAASSQALPQKANPWAQGPCVGVPILAGKKTQKTLEQIRTLESWVVSPAGPAGQLAAARRPARPASWSLSHLAGKCCNIRTLEI